MQREGVGAEGSQGQEIKNIMTGVSKAAHLVGNWGLRAPTFEVRARIPVIGLWELVEGGHQYLEAREVDVGNGSAHEKCRLRLVH
jgi:hypothetical protein